MSTKNESPNAQLAWISWDHHEGADSRLEAHAQQNGKFTPDLLSGFQHEGFMAGWHAAGGELRLEVVDKLQGMIAECCGEEAGEEFCESYGCGTLVNLLSALGCEG